jgi:hypothetical protein
MADKRITELNLHSAVALSDQLAIVNSSETKRTVVGSIGEAVRNMETPLTASSIVSSGDILPSSAQTANLGSAARPFASIFVQSGSISIESDTPGDPSAVISNRDGNLEITVGGMLLVEPDASFIAPTASFSYLSSSFFHEGTAERLGNTIITGSVDITGSFETNLQENYVWLGNSNNRSEAVPYSTLPNLATGSLMITGSLSGSTITFEKGDSSTFDINLEDTFVTPSQTGSFVQSAYISLFSSASQQLVTSGSAQAVTFTSVWAQNGVNLVSGSQIVMGKAGTYQFNFVAQVQNTENAVHDSYFWIKYNGSNFPNSSTQMSLQPRKNESTPSAQLMTVNIVGVAQNDNDYIELYWTGDSDTITLSETPGNGVKPETPSIIANIVRVG